MSDQKAKLAFEIIARENSRMLTAYLRTLVDDESVVDDLFQESMLVAWRRLDECDLSRPFGPWVRGIAGRLVLAHYRKRKAGDARDTTDRYLWLAAAVELLSAVVPASDVKLAGDLEPLVHATSSCRLASSWVSDLMPPG